ncbi:MAG TPA: acetate/propionate family kinase [Woeseiaceae bacterium]|nr:acetate/propionate family kinase [Woeseiaceae bacterium]
MKDSILVLNSGSSSIKFALYDGDGPGLPIIGYGQVSGIGTTARLQAFGRDNAAVVDLQLQKGCNHAQAMLALVDWGRTREASSSVIAVGHRVVHGGELFDTPVQVNKQVLDQLDTLNPLAPLHQPHNLEGIRILAKLLPNLPQVACFDTAFHSTLPKLARQFGLPSDLYERGIRRYGFHGLSYEYMAETLPGVIGAEAAAGRVIVAHMGNGVSMCGMIEGRSVVTTMGFTALDGLPMGTRCGDLDPGIILYLLNELEMSSAQIAELLYEQSGLLGMSGISSDMRVLLQSNATSAREAINFFVYRINRELGAMTATLGGLDALVFTAGIGEHSAPVRRRICELAAWAGIKLDTRANESHTLRISAADSTLPVWVVPTREEWMIARHTYRLLSSH